jgi:putative endonuclease
VNSKSTGDSGEDAAVQFLIGKNFEIIKRNFHSRYGEIDIIVENAEYIIFVEVKSRKFDSLLKGLERVGVSKQKKIIKTACVFLKQNPTKKQPRFDVICINFDPKIKKIKLEHIENAFGGQFADEFF